MVSDKIKSLMKEVEALKQRLKYNPNNGNISYELKEKRTELNQAIKEAREDVNKITPQKFNTRMGMKMLSDEEKFIELKQKMEEDFARRRKELDEERAIEESAKASPEPVVPNTSPEKKSWKQRMGSGAKSAASGLGRGIKATASGIGNGLSYMKDKTVSGGRKVKDAASNIDPSNRLKYELLLGAAIAVHAIDAFSFNFSVANSGIVFARLAMYFILVAMTHAVLQEYTFLGSLWTYGKVAAIPVFAIPFLSIILNLFTLPTAVVSQISAISLAVPVYLFYLREWKQIKFPLGKSVIKFLGNLLFTPSGWSLIWYIVLVWLVMSSLFSAAAVAVPAIPGAENSGFDATQSIDTLFNWVEDSWQKTILSIENIGTGIQGGYDQLYNDSLGGYYTGQVEENKELTGVFITEFKAPDTYYEGLPIRLYGIIKARSFIRDFEMETNCSAQDIRNKSNFISGTTEPSKFTIYREDQRGVICEFPNGLPPGSYRISLSAYFNFETWAYTMYTFMDRDLITSIKVGGENVNDKFEIPLKPKTVYTSGPIKLGMNEELDMPIGLTTEITGLDSNTLVPVGITLDDRVPGLGTKGAIQVVNSLQLRIPKEIEIDKCTIPEYINQGPDLEFSPDYNIYTFNNQRLDLKRTYMTIGCFLRITPSSATSLLKDRGGKAQVSIVGTADYDYLLTKEVTLKVIDDPTTG